MTNPRPIWLWLTEAGEYEGRLGLTRDERWWPLKGVIPKPKPQPPSFSSADHWPVHPRDP